MKSTTTRHAAKTWALALSAAVAASLAWVSPASAQNPPPANTPPANTPAAPGIPAKEVPVGVLKDNETMMVAISPDAARVAVLNKRGDKYVVTLDGVDGKPYDWIVRTTLGFSGDSKAVGYIVQAGDKVMTVINGQEGKPYHEIRENFLAFSPGSGYVYFAKNDRKGKWIAVVNGNEVATELDDVGGLLFSADGKRYAFAADRNEKKFFVIDGKESTSYAKLAGSSFAFSPDGSRYAYVAEKDGKLMPVIDGQEQPAQQEVTRALFSPDSKRVAYTARLGEKRMAVVVDGKPQKEYEMVMGQTMTFSPDSRRLAYIAGRISAQGNKLFYVIDEQETNEYDQLLGNTFLFSPNSQRWCFQAVTRLPVANEQRNRVVVIMDGQQGPDFDQVGLVQFSPDNRNLAYLGQRGAQALVVVNGAVTATYDALGYLGYAKEGNRLAYIATRGSDSFLVLDNKQGKSYAGIVNTSVTWSPDGKHIAYEARRAGENGKAVIVVDEAESADLDGTLRGSRIVWDSPTNLHALVVREKNIFRWEAAVK